MEIRDFARQVLLGTDMSEKLFVPSEFTDDEPGSPIEVPDTPGRPANLPLVSPLPIPAAPTPRGLENETARGVALHTFAHHELQALELMALALLRFPNAPAEFRMGLARIIVDEQRHFSLYRARAEHWGTAIGDVGVGHFFWNTVAQLDTPAAFLAALSLTYEQANLDYAVYWRDAFEAVDDFESAKTLQVVYDDEIQHVRHGVHWFERLMGRCDFETYEKSLVFPLSPGRAKGAIFNREGRHKAGLGQAFIDELEIRNVSRGRPPKVFSFDPFVEDQVAGRTQRKPAHTISEDLASLPMFLAHKEDVVIAPRPSLPVLIDLHHAGFAIPEFATEIQALGERVIGEKRPWGWSPLIAAALDEPWDPRWKTLYDKTWALQCRNEFLQNRNEPLLFGPQGRACMNVREIMDCIERGGTWVAKAPFSTSGQHRMLIEGPIKHNAQQWITRQLIEGPLVIEPWFKRIADVSIHLDISDKNIRVIGLNRFWTVATGTYRGASIGPWTLGLSRQILRELHQGDATKLLNEAGEFIGRRAQELGYRGPLGVDTLVAETKDGPRLLPILEANPRFTMGRIALAIS